PLRRCHPEGRPGVLPPLVRPRAERQPAAGRRLRRVHRRDESARLQRSGHRSDGAAQSRAAARPPGHVMPELAGWESFYVIVGSSAGALTGPTIVHFCVGLVVSAALSAPWRSATGIAVTLGVCGGGGLVYVLNAVHRARRQTDYRPVLEDWLWHSVFPVVAYGAILIGGITLRKAPETSLFAVGAAVLSLVLIGIHNSWDTVTYLAVIRREGRHQSKS